jgi:hypothetical protein
MNKSGGPRFECEQESGEMREVWRNHAARYWCLCQLSLAHSLEAVAGMSQATFQSVLDEIEVPDRNGTWAITRFSTRSVGAAWV